MKKIIASLLVLLLSFSYCTATTESPYERANRLNEATQKFVETYLLVCNGHGQRSPEDRRICNLTVQALNASQQQSFTSMETWAQSASIEDIESTLVPSLIQAFNAGCKNYDLGFNKQTCTEHLNLIKKLTELLKQKKAAL